jgi:D-lyxose ketol-isomerase
MSRFTIYSLMCVLGLSLVAGCGPADGVASSSTEDYTGAKPFSPVAKLETSAFYKKDGSFDQDVAKKAYYDMMKAYHYPIPAYLKGKDFWTADFKQGDFAKLGMAGIFWKNVIGKYGEVGAKAYKGEFKDASYGYLGHEIFLLPGQMLPEHNHFGNGSDKGFGPKMETWHIRHGSVEFFGEYKGPAGETPVSEMPANERPWGYGKDWYKSKFVKKCVAGEIYSLNDPESYHFMRAGPNGAIVAEYATYHNDVKFSHPTMEFGNSEAAKITKVKN